MAQSFELLKDPRITTSDADLAEQFDFQIQIRDKLSEIVTGVNTIRSLKRRSLDWTERLADNEVGGRCNRRREGAQGTARSRRGRARAGQSSHPTATR